MSCMHMFWYVKVNFIIRRVNIVSYLSWRPYHQWQEKWHDMFWCYVFTTAGEGNAPHSSTVAWKIPWMEEPGRLHSMGSLRVRQDWATSLSLSLSTFTFHFHALEKEMATHSSVLAWRIPGMAEPVGLPSMGLHRVEHDWGDLAAAAAN